MRVMDLRRVVMIMPCFGVVAAASAVDLNPSVFDNSFAYGISDGQQVGYGYWIGHERL